MKLFGLVRGFGILCGAMIAMGVANAQTTTTLDAVDRGWYDETGFTTPSNTNYICGDGRGPTCGCSPADFRNFLVFDLSGVKETIVKAHLLMFVPDGNGFASADPSELYELFDVVTDITILRNGTGGIDAHEDLGSGMSYGTYTASSADLGKTVMIPLNDDALAALNAADGLFAFGGAIQTLDALPNDEYVFGFTSELPLSVTQLVVETGCGGDQGFTLKVQTPAGIGEFFDICASGPPGGLVALLGSLGPGPSVSPYGNFCLDFPPLVVFTFTMPSAGSKCFHTYMSCDPTLVGTTGFLQFVELDGDGNPIGISNQAAVAVTDNGACG